MMEYLVCLSTMDKDFWAELSKWLFQISIPYFSFKSSVCFTRFFLFHVFYASVFNCWICFDPDSCTAVGGREIQNGSKYLGCATRFQWALSLCIPNATQRPRTISPVFTRFLFQNRSGLPSRLRFFSEFFQTKFAEISRIFYNEVKKGQLGSL